FLFRPRFRTGGANLHVRAVEFSFLDGAVRLMNLAADGGESDGVERVNTPLHVPSVIDLTLCPDKGFTPVDFAQAQLVCPDSGLLGPSILRRESYHPRVVVGS